MSDTQTKIHPTAGYILVKPQKKELTTSSGIVLPESHEEKPQQGVVLSIGDVYITDNGTQKNSPCQVGDTVIYKEWGGREYKEENTELLIIKFEDVMAIIK
jgi:chaperonin GroES